MTLVTALYDLGSYGDSDRPQDLDFYLAQAAPVLALDAPMVIFTDAKIAPVLAKVIPGPSNKTIVPYALTRTNAWQHKSEIEVIRQHHPLRSCNLTKDTPLYAVFQLAKIELLEHAATINLADTTHFAWIDIGIAKAVSLSGATWTFQQALQLDRVELLTTDQINTQITDWQELRSHIAAGYIAGDCASVLTLCAAFQTKARQLRTDGYVPHDETLLESLADAPCVQLRRIYSYNDIFGATNLLGLVMIVKNEAHGIVETLQSFKPYIDHWTILDTGSTDGTQDLIHSTLKDIPGRLYEEPFVDFATSRNRALDLHGEATRYSIMPDSDDRLVSGKILRIFLEGQEEDINISVRSGDHTYLLPLVRRTTKQARYTGRVHEYTPQGVHTAPLAVQLTKEPKPISIEASKQRWERDIKILEEDLQTNPNDSRAAFYLAQTYECLGRINDAIKLYETCSTIATWTEEKFNAKLRRAKLIESNSSWELAQQAYLEAHACSPDRAEGLFAIASYYHKQDQHALAYLFARAASELPLPTVSSFIDREIYTWKALDLVAVSGFYTSQKSVGRSAVTKAIAGRPDDERLRSNRAFYAQSVGETFAGASIRAIDYTPAAPYVATNPSIYFDGDRWRCLVRTTNYRIVNGHYLTPDDNIIYTKNVVLDLNNDLTTAKVTELRDLDSTPRSDFPVHGFEDCRFLGDRASATVCDFASGDAKGRREIVLLTIDGDAITAARPLRSGQWAQRHQKNWMPIVDRPGEFIYSISPLVIIDADNLPVGDLPCGRLRGGSQVISVGTGYLCIVHDVTFSGSSRTYLHRFVQLNRFLEVVGMSDVFYFVKRGIEFCAGLARDGSRLIASFGVDDSSAYLAEFDLKTVLDTIREDYVI